jgi:transcriptional regulator
MYQPIHFREERLEVLHELIRTHPLGLLITARDGTPMANPVPFMVHADMSPLGTLRAHLARANPQADALYDGAEALIVFQGPQAYITPSWYATKQEHGKVVPTWNYIIVQARGLFRLHDDAAWVRAQVEELTHRHESARAKPWAVDDAPDSYIASQVRAIVGVEIEIMDIVGKWKVSQNRPMEDRVGVHAGMTRETTASGAADMATLVKIYGGLPKS